LPTLHQDRHEREFSLVNTDLSDGAAHTATIQSDVGNEAPVSFAVGTSD
jgi:hypothetical protein